MTCSPIPLFPCSLVHLFQGNDKGCALVPPWPSSREHLPYTLWGPPPSLPSGEPVLVVVMVKKEGVGEGVPLFGRFGLFGQIPSLRQLPKNPKNAEKFGFSKFSIQSKREAKPQRFAGTSQLILVQSLLYIKSSTNDCNCTTISFNTIQLAFP